MKYGLDIHGVSDTKKKFFSLFSQRAIANGHEVHVITGNMRTPQIEAELKEYGIHYTHFFGVADKLLADGKVAFWKDKDNPFFDEKDWNKVKGEYCAEQGINLHFDDSDEYRKHFTTLYLKVV
jgi:hypothetical protein